MAFAELFVGQEFPDYESAEAYRIANEGPNRYGGISISYLQEDENVVLGYHIDYTNSYMEIKDLDLQLQNARKIIGIAFGTKLETRVFLVSRD